MDSEQIISALDKILEFFKDYNLMLDAIEYRNTKEAKGI